MHERTMQVFRSVLNLKLKFSMEELETALLVPNALLDDIHIGLLKVHHIAVSLYL